MYGTCSELMRISPVIAVFLLGVVLVACNRPDAAEWVDVAERADRIMRDFDDLERELNSDRFTLALKATYGFCLEPYVEAARLEDRVRSARFFTLGYVGDRSHWFERARDEGDRDFLVRFTEGLGQREQVLRSLEAEAYEFEEKTWAGRHRRCLRGCRSVMDAPNC